MLSIFELKTHNHKIDEWTRYDVFNNLDNFNQAQEYFNELNGWVGKLVKKNCSPCDK